MKERLGLLGRQSSVEDHVSTLNRRIASYDSARSITPSHLLSKRSLRAFEFNGVMVP
jgi:hypothetical protein